MEIIISGKDKKRLKLVEQLAKELGLSITKSKLDSKSEEPELSDEERSEKLYQLMEEMAASGGIESIKDPVAWQKEIRKERSLPGRD